MLYINTKKKLPDINDKKLIPDFAKHYGRFAIRCNGQIYISEVRVGHPPDSDIKGFWCADRENNLYLSCSEQSAKSVIKTNRARMYKIIHGIYKYIGISVIHEKLFVY